MAASPDPGCGTFQGSVHFMAMRVHFEDTDLSGMVYHANYLRWLERARSDMIRLLGIDQRAAYEAGEGIYAVTELIIRYRSPARLDDIVTIESRAKEVRAATCRIDQRVLRGEDVLAEAGVSVAFVSESGRPRRQPEAWRRAFAAILPDQGA